MHYPIPDTSGNQKSCIRRKRKTWLLRAVSKLQNFEVRKKKSVHFNRTVKFTLLRKIFPNFLRTFKVNRELKFCVWNGPSIGNMNGYNSVAAPCGGTVIELPAPGSIVRQLASHRWKASKHSTPQPVSALLTTAQPLDPAHRTRQRRLRPDDHRGVHKKQQQEKRCLVLDPAVH